MPTWGELLQELNQLARTAPPGSSPSPHDILRRKYLLKLTQLTGRAVIFYGTAWLESRENLTADLLSIGLGDMQGFMEAVSNIREKELDLILHSPGGNAEAAESIVHYLRTRFDHIRVIVPLAAMSAATMIALAADEILMGSHSQLGPIDPQFSIQTPEGPRSAPAQAIKDQFEMAKTECQNPSNIGAWLPILRSYSPGLLAQCDHQRALAEDTVAANLERYMFAGQNDAGEKAKRAAGWFADFQEFKSHGRRVGSEEARSQSLNVVDLESDQELQHAVLSVFHAFQHTFAGTTAAKIIENHHGRAWVIARALTLHATPRPTPPAPQPGPRGASHPESRAARRRKERGK